MVSELCLGAGTVSLWVHSHSFISHAITHFCNPYNTYHFLRRLLKEICYYSETIRDLENSLCPLDARSEKR